MGFWYVLATLVSMVASAWVSERYSRKCRSTAKQPYDHGAHEFNATFFALQFLLLWFLAHEWSDAWLFACIGSILALYVIARFWRNWDRHENDQSAPS